MKPKYGKADGVGEPLLQRISAGGKGAVQTCVWADSTGENWLHS